MKWNKQIRYQFSIVFLAVITLINGCNQTAGGIQSTTTPPANVMSTDTSTTPENSIATKTTIATSNNISLDTTQKIRDINVLDAFKLIQENKDNPNFIIIDIRTREEFEAGHLENAVLIDYYAENFRDEIGKQDRNKTYLEYCRTARRSTLALEIFKELGFKDVLNMTGGITEWLAQNLPIVK